MKITLTKPVDAHGKEVGELELREEILGKDIRRCGVPFSVEETSDGTSIVKFDADRCAKYMSELCAVPPSSIDQLAAQDFRTLMGHVIRLFREETQQTSSTDAGSSQGSTAAA